MCVLFHFRIPKDFYDTPPPKKPKSILKNSTTSLAAYSSSSSSSEDEDEAPHSSMLPSTSSSTSAMLSSHPANPSLPAGLCLLILKVKFLLRIFDYFTQNSQYFV